MREIPWLLLLCACTSLDTSRAAGPEEAAPRPNIVFIYSDDHAASALGCYGSSFARTPNIDRLAREGMVFENAFCTNAICAPARAVVLTGRHSHLNGVRDNGDSFDGSQTTFPQLLQRAGYRTALVGKWHLKSDPTGFDHWEVLPGQGEYYGPDLRGPEGERHHEGYTTDILTDHALEWLAEAREAERPFLLMLQHKAPHRTWIPGPAHLDDFEDVEIPEPASLFDTWEGRSRAATLQEMTIARHMDVHYDLQVPREGSEEEPWWRARMTDGERSAWDRAFASRNEAFRESAPAGDALTRWKFQRYLKNYLRCVQSIDDSVGRVLAWLAENDLAENTIVVYTSDQGFFLGEHGWYDKRFMYEPALRIPLVVRWPATVAAGSREVRLVQNLDLAPTLLAAAGVPVPQEMQGVSLLPLLAGDRTPGWRDSIYYQYYERGIHAVEPHYGVRTERHKLICFPGLDQWELYDLANDPEELHNLYGDSGREALAGALRDELRRLREVYRVPED